MIGVSLDSLTPAQYRERYDALVRGARATAPLFAGAERHTATAIPAEAIRRHDVVPAGWYWSARVARGTTLRIHNTSGTPGVAAFFWSAHDPSERYCLGDTVKIQWTVRPSAGRMLLSDMGRVLASLVADSGCTHETLLGGTMRDPGEAESARNTRDNLLLAAGKHGLGKRDLAPFVTFFAGVDADPSGRFSWANAACVAGDFVDLRAEMDLIVALSNTPHPLAQTRAALGPIDAILWNGPTLAPGDPCRTATVEARRAFENTDALVRG
jgi:urea carboxylase-associated protein 2